MIPVTTITESTHFIFGFYTELAWRFTIAFALLLVISQACYRDTFVSLILISVNV